MFFIKGRVLPRVRNNAAVTRNDNTGQMQLNVPSVLSSSCKKEKKH
jgi:hypothetical protein